MEHRNNTTLDIPPYHRSLSAAAEPARVDVGNKALQNLEHVAHLGRLAIASRAIRFGVLQECYWWDYKPFDDRLFVSPLDPRLAGQVRKRWKRNAPQR
jgi:hypothetical protein